MQDSFFGRMRSGASAVARMFKGAVEAFNSDNKAFNPESTDPRWVRSLIPRSHFTKRGPGVRRSAQLAFASMTRGQRTVARFYGWLR